MSMSNDSNTNEKLIQQCMNNISATKHNKVSRLYWTIINNSILGHITSYRTQKVLTDDDAILHHGTTRIQIEQHYPNKDNNVAKALTLLRQHLPYKLAKWLVSKPENMQSDSLYHAINDWKFQCNSDFYQLFNLSKT